jgi:predicted GNAT family acetyltransferase
MADIEDQEVEISDEKDADRYEIAVGGKLAGIAEYRLDGEAITFTHTEVDPAFGGQGLGSRLIEFAVTDARSRKLEIDPRCPFVRKWVEENPEDR